MRIVYTFALAAVVVFMHVLDNPEFFNAGLSESTKIAASFWNDKKVKLEGLLVLTHSDIEPLLPHSRSVLWWHLNEPEIQARLMDNPWIKSASVDSCDEGLFSKWGCFVLRIQEREPVFSAVVDGTTWIVDGDGSFIVPDSDVVLRRYDMKLVSIKGLASRVSSPDVVRSQLYSASSFMTILQKEVGKAVVSLAFIGHGDLKVNFQGLPFPVIFGLESSNGVTLAEQGKRCAALLHEVRNRYSDIDKIDLAFNRVGVVSFRVP